MKKILSMVLVIALVAGIAISGTMAYLTDRDNETNVFTVGDVDIELEGTFANGVELLPGNTHTINPTIKNVGKNAAWVWLTYAVPKNLAGVVEISDSLGDKWVKAADSYNFEVDIDVDEDTTTPDAKYKAFVLLYEDPLAAENGVTSEAFGKIALASSVDVTPEGDWYTVVSGDTDPLGWNTEADGAPFVFVNAYAIQEDMFDSATAALEAYVDQWGRLNGKYEISAPADEWDGTADTAWYDETATEFELYTAEAFAGFAELVDGGEDFAGKTIKLEGNLDLYVEGADGDPVSFEPIGCFSENKAFEGTFDGQGNTISNLYQNGWALENGYWDGDVYGLGFFGLVENATVKNVNFDGASLPTEANIMGVVASGAANCVFENVTVTNSYMGNHSWYSGGIVGWAEGDVKFINCDVDENTVISSQWGDFNNANGGIIGGCDPTSTIYMKDCDVACVIDAYNDVTSAYEWYSYRSCGMLIGDTGQKDDPDGDNVGNAIAPNLTCENVTVTYGNWANYHYCEFGSAGYPFCRVEAGESTGAYGNARVGEYTDANGNKVVDDNHVHNANEKHNELIVFDQLYGGETGDRYCTYGTATHPGVTVIYNNK